MGCVRKRLVEHCTRSSRLHDALPAIRVVLAFTSTQNEHKKKKKKKRGKKRKLKQEKQSNLATPTSDAHTSVVSYKHYIC